MDLIYLALCSDMNLVGWEKLEIETGTPLELIAGYRPQTFPFYHPLIGLLDLMPSNISSSNGAIGGCFFNSFGSPSV